MIYKTKDYGIFHLKTENRSLREDILSNLTDSFKNGDLLKVSRFL